MTSKDFQKLVTLLIAGIGLYFSWQKFQAAWRSFS
jgi:hypothetical protein